MSAPHLRVAMTAKSWMQRAVISRPGPVRRVCLPTVHVEPFPQKFIAILDALSAA
jgi:hypothetical protein